MKKVLSVLVLAMCIVMLLSFASCGMFMSASSVNKVVREFGTPQAQMTLSFTTSANNKFKYVITYDLLLEKTPITTINFINLVESGFYKDAIFESYNTTNNYYLAGRYTYKKDAESGNSHGYENVSGITIPGEFKTNGYKEPKGGYEKFSMFSLAMYHDNAGKSFDSADGTLIFSTASSASTEKVSLNYTNYAVFAKMVSIDIYEDDNETPRTYPGDKLNSLYWDNLIKLTSTTSCSMTKSNGDSSSVTVLGSGSIPRFVFSIEMLGDKDWSKLPKVN